MSQTIKADDTLDEHLSPGKENDDAAYVAWKEAKIRAGLAQSKDRSEMIPAHKLWAELGLER